MRLSSEALIRALPPSGATTKQMAEKLGAGIHTVGSRLSKLCLYGLITRDVVRRPGAGGPYMLWRTK